MTLFVRSLAIMVSGVLLFGLFSYGAMAGTSHHLMGDGAMHHVCPLIGTTPGCVNVLEHLSHWLHSFVAVCIELSPLLLLVTLSFALWVRLRTQLSIDRDTSPLRHRTRTRLLLPRTALQILFAQGILHPKIFH